MLLNQHLSQKQIEAMSLWRSCFEDSEDFIQLYFSRVYRDEDTLIGYTPDGTTAVSHTQALPYKLQLAEGTTPLPVGYISGACTLAEYRGQGYMQRLMEEALGMMYERGDVASFLIPASDSLYIFYRQGFGYGTAFYEEEIDTAIPLDLAEVNTLDIASALMQAEANRTSYRILHNLQQWQAILADYDLGEQSHVASLHNELGEVEAVSLYVDLEKQVLLKACYALSEKSPELLQVINPNTKPLRQIIPARVGATGQWQPKGMLRPLRLYELLKHWGQGLPTLTLHVYVEDNLFPDNTGSYHIDRGSVTYTKTCEPDAVRLGLPDLVEQLAQLCPLSMSLMME